MPRLLSFLGILALVGGLFYLVRDPGRLPLLDANRQLLAQTEAEAYCAGVIVEATNYSKNGDADRMASCLANSNLGTETNLGIVPAAFCVPLSIPDCMDQVKGYMVWPTLAGGWTTSWNRTFPYPLESFTTGTIPSESRTGDRLDFGRESNTR